MTIWLAAALAVVAPSVAAPAEKNLPVAVAAQSDALFKTVFAECNPAKLRSMLTDDFEMYHDRDGVVATSAETFVADYAKDCAKPHDWHSRRAVVAGSVTFDLVPGFGAIEDGDHVFYEWKTGAKERLAGRAHFTHLWKLAPDGWRLARVLSFKHQAIE